MKFIVHIILVSLCIVPAYAERRQVIGCQSGAGLFYNFLGVVNNLLWCEKNNAKPIVYWGPHCLYCEEKGYNGSYNVWEYYFEPVSDDSYKSGDLVWEFNMAPDSTEIRPVSQEACTSYENRELRKSAHAVIKRYIKLKPIIKNKIDSFFQSHMAHTKTIGIHLRGTDKKSEVKPINVRHLFDKANKLQQMFPDCQFLVATDEEALLEQAKAHLRGKVLYYNAYRSTDGVAVHWQNKAGKAQLGEEVIIEAYLLARCDFFLHGCSSVSSAVLFLNPDLKHLSFSPG